MAENESTSVLSYATPIEAAPRASAPSLVVGWLLLTIGATVAAVGLVVMVVSFDQGRFESPSLMIFAAGFLTAYFGIVAKRPPASK